MFGPRFGQELRRNVLYDNVDDAMNVETFSMAPYDGEWLLVPMGYK